MKLAFLFTALPLLTSTTAIPAVTIKAPPAVRTVCELKKLAARQSHGGEVVSITASAFYNFEAGYFLQDLTCEDPIDGTGLIRIVLPHGYRDEDFPELLKLSSQSWLSEMAGKRVRCNCIGTAYYEHGNVTYTLKVAKDRASN